MMADDATEHMEGETARADAEAVTEHAPVPLKLDSLDDVVAAVKPFQDYGTRFCEVLEASQVLLHGNQDAIHKFCVPWGVKRYANKRSRTLGRRPTYL